MTGRRYRVFEKHSIKFKYFIQEINAANLRAAPRPCSGLCPYSNLYQESPWRIKLPALKADSLTAICELIV
jgi:hypothetical protein